MATDNDPAISFLGTGWAFPPAFAGGGAVMTADEADIHDSLVILFGTAAGERLFAPKYGLDMHELLFEPMSTTMRTLLQDRYCPVCREHMVRSLYAATGGNLLETVEPRLDQTVTLAEGDAQTFTASALTVPGGMRWSWAVDGVEVSTAPDAFTYTYEGCGGPRGDVSLTVSDPTDWVRTDPQALLTQTITWSVDTARCPGDPACDGCDASGDAALPALSALLALLLRRRR